MAIEVVGGGSSAVASSSHAGCARFRGTDPLITGLTRRNLAKAVGHADTSGAIPQARWMRAMTFERLVRNESFASQVATRTVGALQLDRPSEVVTVDAHMNVDTTVQLLNNAHERAVATGAATLVFQLAVPFIGFEDTRATDVKPDFAVVAPAGAGRTTSWLVMGDAKDYERVRSRIDDGRMLKGFLQVAVGAASARAWSQLPTNMAVHNFGVLAVPRNAFLQPTPIVENLHDYGEEVRLRIDERRRVAEESGYMPDQDLTSHVEHLEATFDPATCTTCTLFSYCRNELRQSTSPGDLLIELGVSRDMRRQALGLVDGASEIGRVPASTAANIEATLTGLVQVTGQVRVDSVGTAGTVNVVLAKSDAAALGVHGIGLQRVTADGRGDWEYMSFDDPQSSETRRLVMRRIGTVLNRAMREQRKASSGDVPSAVHLVVPDAATADVLVSIADNLAGIELSRLRWQRDKEEGRPAITYDGEPATIPRPIGEVERTAIALLLEDDRSRAFGLRSPTVDVRTVLARHFVAGGPTTNSGRLDYLVGWAESQSSGAIGHRAFADAIENSDHTPGARLTNVMSDDIHEALVGKRGKAPDDPVAEPELYALLVTDELQYKARVLERAIDVLAMLPTSALRAAYETIESEAQQVWRRRLKLHASDLVRFGRTYRPWRNSLVPMIESDGSCASQLLALSNPQAAHDLASDAGNRFIAFATVVSSTPLMLDIESRRIVDGSRVVMLTHNGEACVEQPAVHVNTSAGGSFKIDGLAIGPLATQDPAQPKRMLWAPQTVPTVSVGDELVIADFTWFSDLKGNRVLSVAKPKPDTTSAPKVDCLPESYGEDPPSHLWCCRSHEASEAEFSDRIADRRAKGELNPETWPPVRDGDAFEVTAAGSATGNAFDVAPRTVPDDQTMDDLE
ncbi:MAG: hypothetical protein ACTINZ_10980 [Microbacterium gubbeenense]|uniref:hypothetical protein n=1 Tax=Microbacterium gubbeenense TaxID=159896 RepID=UPI00048AE88C|nr:hypothetical protein [Microbacterium gubbeenense]